MQLFLEIGHFSSAWSHNLEMAVLQLEGPGKFNAVGADMALEQTINRSQKRKE